MEKMPSAGSEFETPNGDLANAGPPTPGVTKPWRIHCASALALAISIFLPWVHVGMGGLLFAFSARNNGSLTYWQAERPWASLLLVLCTVGACGAFFGRKPWHCRISMFCAAATNGIIGITLLRLLMRMTFFPGNRDLRAFLSADLALSWGWPFLIGASLVMTASAVAGLRERGITILPRLDREFFRAQAKWIAGVLGVLLAILAIVGYLHSQRPRHYHHSVSPEQASQAHYELIKEGMTYEEVTACLGVPNYFPPREVDLKPGKECWGHWGNDFPVPGVGLAITVRFLGGRVVEKFERHRGDGGP